MYKALEERQPNFAQTQADVYRALVKRFHFRQRTQKALTSVANLFPKPACLKTKEARQKEEITSVDL